jgi:hypothetical protein
MQADSTNFRTTILLSRWILVAALMIFAIATASAQVTGTIQGKVYDATGAVVPGSSVTAVSTATQLTRTTTSNASGDYNFSLLPVGEYTVTADKSGFHKGVKKVELTLGAVVNIDFNLAVGEVKQEVVVQDVGAVAEPTRTMVSSVIEETKIQNLPVNGRQFIDFALLAPGVTVGDTTSGSTDVIIEPVTKLSFAGQNIHYNFVAIDGADNMSTASGIQKTTPSQEAVREFQVVNTDYTTQFGRAVGGIVNVVTRSGTNNLHGSLYEYFRNDKLDAKNPLVSRDPATGRLLDKLRQNQFGFTLGGPIVKNKTFFFGNYEGQRHVEAPFYNSVILNNINAINAVKVNTFGLPAENLNVSRNINYDNLLGKLDHSFNSKQYLFVRYFFNDQRGTNLSPLNDGFDLPSGYKDNNFRDQSLVGNLTSTVRDNLVNEVRLQYAHRTFDFPTVTTQPHLEVTNIFTVGVNRGNPDIYTDHRFELVDNLTWIKARHSISVGGDFNHVNTTESFPLFYPFEADFPSLGAFLGTDCPFGPVPGFCPLGPYPNAIFFERFPDPGTSVTSLANFSTIYNGGRIPANVRSQTHGELGHTYSGLYIQDKWRVTDNLTVNIGLRWEGETFPSNVLNNVTKNFDPRVGFSYAVGGNHRLVLRGGGGLFHGVIPTPLLMCQYACGGQQKYPGRENKEDNLNAGARIAVTGGAPDAMAVLFNQMMTQGQYPLLATGAITGATAAAQDAVIVRFAQDHKPPYGVQASLGIEVQPFKDAALSITGMHVRGIHLSSFWNVNQPDPTAIYSTDGAHQVHDSKGHAGFKNLYCPYIPLGFPGDSTIECLPKSPGQFPLLPGFRDPAFGVYFEADSKWDSVWDGLLVNFSKRMSNHFEAGASYTWSKGLDNGPNPSFVLIPQDSCLGDPTCTFRRERTISSDHVGQRLVLNATIEGPTKTNRVVNGFKIGTIISLEGPHYFTKFAGFDANGDVFGVNDRVGIEPRNTFKGDTFKSVDLRLSREFTLTEKLKFQFVAEGFNLFNKKNVRFFNTVYGAGDFCNIPSPNVAQGCPATPSGNREGSPNASYGTPRAVFNPRQIQFAARLTW